MSKKYLRNWFNYMCAAHYSLGEQIDNDSGGPFVDQHFELVLVLSQFPLRCFQVETVVQNKVSQ